MKKVKLSKKLLIALKLGGRRQYQVAAEAGIDPSVLSKLVNGITPIFEDDLRVLAIGKVLGLSPEDCFDKVTQCRN